MLTLLLRNGTRHCLKATVGGVSRSRFSSCTPVASASPSTPPSNNSSSNRRENVSVPDTVCVLMSQSHCVFTNLALETWLYKQKRFQRSHMLLLWRNRPCVVIGRHQNPWQEVAPGLLAPASPDADGVCVARRNSGGGCVYHDLGNLNMTFFTGRGDYNRRANLQLVADTLIDTWGLNVSVNERDDLLLDDKHKISGTAAKLTRDSAYHHCTLMVNVDLSALKAALPPKPVGLESGATNSVRAPAVANIGSGNRSVTVDSVAAALGRAYLSQYGPDRSRGFHLVNPRDDWFPGISLIEDELRDDGWVYGHTPPFSHTFRLSTCADLRVCVNVKKGKVVSIVPVSPDNVTDVSCDDWVRSILPSASPECLQSLVGSSYSTAIVQQAESALLGINTGQSGCGRDKRLLAL